MAGFRHFLLRLLSPFRNDRAEHELSREVDSHLALLEDEFIARGMTPADAKLAARRAFGGVDQAKEHQRDARSGGLATFREISRTRCARSERTARSPRPRC